MDVKKISKCKKYAIESHSNVNHEYDGKSYSIHLLMVYEFGVKFIYLIPDEDITKTLSACWTHDIIEDCRETYNDVKNICGEDVAELTYALTNEKGKTRSDRANKAYYDGITATPMASFIKICDRLANVKYSKDSGSGMFKKYKKEYGNFARKLYDKKYHDMFVELELLLFDKAIKC